MAACHLRIECTAPSITSLPQTAGRGNTESESTGEDEEGEDEEGEDDEEEDEEEEDEEEEDEGKRAADKINSRKRRG